MPPGTKLFDVRVIELSGQAQSAISGAILAGIRAAQSASNQSGSAALGKINPAGSNGAGAGGGIGGGKIGSFITTAASSPIGMLQSLGIAGAAAAAALKTVSLAAPGVVERLNLAFEDTLAVIGQRLAPAFEALGMIIRFIGDVINSILPDASAMREGMGTVRDFLKSLGDAIAPIAKFIQTVLTVALKALGVALQVLMIPINFLVGIIQGLIGSEEKLASSVGAAVRNITFTTSDAFQKAAYTAAYKNSAGGGIEETVGGISKTLSGIGADVKAIAVKIGAVARLPATIQEGIRIGGGDSIAAQAAKDAIVPAEGKGEKGENGGIARGLGFNLGNKTKAPESANSIREMLGLGAGGKGKEPEPKKDDRFTIKQDGNEVTYEGLSPAQQREMLEISKRRFLDGHPRGS